MKRGSQPSSYYPIFLDLSGRKCVVVGGGPVALRKVKALMEHGGNVQVISPDLCPELARMVEEGAIQVLQKGYQSGGLEGAFIVIAATDDKEINSRVAREAGEGLNTVCRSRLPPPTIVRNRRAVRSYELNMESAESANWQKSHAI